MYQALAFHTIIRTRGIISGCRLVYIAPKCLCLQHLSLESPHLATDPNHSQALNEGHLLQQNLVQCHFVCLKSFLCCPPSKKSVMAPESPWASFLFYILVKALECGQTSTPILHPGLETNGLGLYLLGYPWVWS